MFNLDPVKLLIIAVVAMILLGPDKLPQLARQVGAGWRSLNEFRHRMEADVRGQVPDLPSTHEIAHYARSPRALLDRLAAMNDKDGAGADGATAANGANGNDPSQLPDGAPIEPFPAGTAPVPAPTTGPADVPVFGDPSLN